MQLVAYFLFATRKCIFANMSSLNNLSVLNSLYIGFAEPLGIYFLKRISYISKKESYFEVFLFGFGLVTCIYQMHISH